MSGRTQKRHLHEARCHRKKAKDWPTDHVVPRGHYTLHIKITREESDHTIRDDLAVFDKDATKVTYNRRIVPDFEPGADGHLVTPACDNLHGRFHKLN